MTYKEDIEKWLRENEDKDYDRLPRTIFASELGKCLRETYFKFFKKAPRTLGDIKNYHKGNVREWDVIRMIGDYNDIEKQKGVTTYIKNQNLRIAGKADAIVYKEDDTRDVIEKKAIGNVFGKEKHGSSKHHLMQMVFYMISLGIDKGFMLYTDNDFDIYEEGFEREEVMDMFEEGIERAKTVMEHIDDKAVPEAESKKNQDSDWLGWMCKYCSYKEICDKMSEDEVDEEDLEFEWRDEVGEND